MSSTTEATLSGPLAAAFTLITSADADLVEIIALSLRVSMSAVAIACLIGMPLGALVACSRFYGRGLVSLILNALMGLPPVTVGLLVYLMISASGPLGIFQLLYTPAAMIIAQTVLVTPIVAALTRDVVATLHDEYREEFDSLGLSSWQQMGALLRDARYRLVTVALAGFGRAIAEVGAVIIVGGNINHVTRVMTTTIALETSRGNLELALALGLVLLTIALIVNASLMGVSRLGARISA